MARKGREEGPAVHSGAKAPIFFGSCGTAKAVPFPGPSQNPLRVSVGRHRDPSTAFDLRARARRSHSAQDDTSYPSKIALRLGSGQAKGGAAHDSRVPRSRKSGETWGTPIFGAFGGSIPSPGIGGKKIGCVTEVLSPDMLYRWRVSPIPWRSGTGRQSVLQDGPPTQKQPSEAKARIV
jgi:hypothetical protein